MDNFSGLRVSSRIPANDEEPRTETEAQGGDVVTIYPAATSMPEMIARLNELPRPPSLEERDDEELPERAGL